MLWLLWGSFWGAFGLPVRIKIVQDAQVQAQFATDHMVPPMHRSHAGPAQNSEVGYCLTSGPKIAGARPDTWKYVC